MTIMRMATSTYVAHLPAFLLATRWSHYCHLCVKNPKCRKGEAGCLRSMVSRSGDGFESRLLCSSSFDFSVLLRKIGSGAGEMRWLSGWRCLLPYLTIRVRSLRPMWGRRELTYFIKLSSDLHTYACMRECICTHMGVYARTHACTHKHTHTQF